MLVPSQERRPSIGLAHQKVVFELGKCHILSRDKMVIGSSWGPGNLSLPSLTQWLLRNTRVCKGLNGRKTREKKLNWIKSLTKSDIIKIRIGVQCNLLLSLIRPPTLSFAIGQRFQNKIGYRMRCTKNS